MAIGEWGYEEDEMDSALRALLADFESDGQVDGFLDFAEGVLDVAEKVGVPGAKEAKEAVEELNDKDKKSDARRRKTEQELQKARQNEAERAGREEAERKAEIKQRPLKARNRLLEDALRDRIAQVAQLVKERETIRARLRELEADAAEADEGWSTEAKIAGGVATAGILLAVLKKLNDRSRG